MEYTWTDELHPAVRPAPVHRAIPPLVAAACVAVGILLAVVGDSATDGPAPVERADRAAAAAFVADSGAAHRKQVFDERRARFDLAHGDGAKDVAARR